MKYPNLVYISPGDHQCKGGTFSYIQVKNNDDLKAAKKDGYYLTIEDALKKTNSAEASKTDDNKPPTRKEMLKKAKELKITFANNISDKNLLKKIDEKLAE